MRRRKILALLLCLAMVAGLLPMGALADEPVYVLMNIPYADFYAAELGVDAARVDAVTSATLNKPRTGGLAGGSYHVNSDGRDITGVIYPVKVDDLSALSGYTEITDNSSVDITVTNRGKTTTTTYSGKDALFESASYSYYVLNDTPPYYKELTVEASKMNFGPVMGKAAQEVNGAFGEVTVGGYHADIEIKLSGTTGIAQGDTVSAVVLTFDGGSKMGLRHIENIWRATELGGSVSELAGKTITSVRYYTQKEVIDFPLDESLSIPNAGYVLMNIPYGDFYKAELGENDPVVDAVTAATKKAYDVDNKRLVNGSYHNGAYQEGEATNILGVTYPVFVTDTTKLSGKPVAADALFSAGDYAYSTLTEKPNASKTLTFEDETKNFSAVSGRPAPLENVTVSVTSLTKRGDYQIDLAGEGAKTFYAYKEPKVTVCGVVLTDSDGKKYALRHLENIWNAGTELAICTGHTDTIKNGAVTPNSAMYKSLEGKTVKEIKYFVKDSQGAYKTYTIATELVIPTYPAAAFTNASTVKISGLNETDAETAAITKDTNLKKYYSATVYTGTGVNKTEFASELDISSDGTITLGKAAASGTYTIEIIQTKTKTNNNETTKESDVMATMTATYTAPSSSGGSSSVASYDIVVADGVTNGAVKPDRSSVGAGTRVTVTVTPDQGYKLDKLTATDKNGKDVALTQGSDGIYTFTMPNSKVTLSAAFVKDDSAQPAPTPADNEKFVDVAKDAYFHDPVYWAVKKGVTEGVDATHFAPNASCTRAQMVTFLWRAAGKPAPASAENPFTDVKADAYYHDAVLWAVEKGITVGTSKTTFSPDATVTRGQSVTFLYRFTGEKTDGANPFTDVSEGAYYYDAVLWAAAKNVTAGKTATTFAPSDDCLRGQIVTFLYRAMGQA